jgi:hypothetical protein
MREEREGACDVMGRRHGKIRMERKMGMRRRKDVC